MTEQDPTEATAPEPDAAASPSPEPDAPAPDAGAAHAGAAGPAGGPGEPSEEELRAALEAELERIRVGDVLVQTIVTLINLAGRRIGLAPGTEGDRDLDQVHDAIEAVRALLPIVEAREGEPLTPVREALSQLQLGYAQLARQGAGGEPGGGEPGGGAQPGGAGKPGDGGSGPAQSSGRLWVPGQ